MITCLSNGNMRSVSYRKCAHPINSLYCQIKKTRIENYFFSKSIKHRNNSKIEAIFSKVRDIVKSTLTLTKCFCNFSIFSRAKKGRYINIITSNYAGSARVTICCDQKLQILYLKIPKIIK